MAQTFNRRTLSPILIFFSLLVVAGCAPVQIDPPELYLDLGPPPAPRISQVEVTNSAGKTVMSGRTNLRGELNSNPGLADLDGTLTIKSTWSDGDVTTQTITHTPNTRISLTYNTSQRGFVVVEIPSSSVIEDAPERAGD